MATDTNVNNLVINKMTKSQYNALKNAGQVNSTELYMITDSAEEEIITNKVTSLNASSTDTQYPSAKCVYDAIGNIETLLQGV